MKLAPINFTREEWSFICRILPADEHRQAAYRDLTRDQFYDLILESLSFRIRPLAFLVTSKVTELADNISHKIFEYKASQGIEVMLLGEKVV